MFSLLFQKEEPTSEPEPETDYKNIVILFLLFLVLLLSSKNERKKKNEKTEKKIDPLDSII